MSVKVSVRLEHDEGESITVISVVTLALDTASDGNISDANLLELKKNGVEIASVNLAAVRDSSSDSLDPRNQVDELMGYLIDEICEFVNEHIKGRIIKTT